MSSIIYYSLKNDSHFDSFSFNGEEVKVATFRNEIMDLEFSGNLNSSELDVIDFNSRKKYTDEENLKKNSYVIISRVPKIVLTSSVIKAAPSSPAKINHQVATIQPYTVDSQLNTAGNMDNNQPGKNKDICDSTAGVNDGSVQYYSYCYVDQMETDAFKNNAAYLPPPPYSPHPKPATFACQTSLQQPALILPSYVQPPNGIYQSSPNVLPTYPPFLGHPHFVPSFYPPPMPAPPGHPLFLQPVHTPFPTSSHLPENYYCAEHRMAGRYQNSVRRSRTERFQHCDERRSDRGGQGRSSSNNDFRNRLRSKSPLRKRSRHRTDEKYSAREKRRHRYDYSCDDDDYRNSKSVRRKHRNDLRSRRRSRSKCLPRSKKNYESSRSESYDSDDIIKVNNGVDINTIRKEKRSCRDEDIKDTAKEDVSSSSKQHNDDEKQTRSPSRSSSLRRKVTHKTTHKTNFFEDDSSTSSSTTSSSEDTSQEENFQSSKPIKKIVSVVNVTTNRKTVSNQLSPNLF